MLFPCCACGVEKSEESFSNSQRKKDLPRCTDCVASQAPAQRDVNISSFRRCSIDGWRPTSEFTGTSTLCDARAKEKREREANQALRHSGLPGACRVKEVKQRYGHVCEIPLEAYLEAGVAQSKNDFVTDQDVMAASNAWDARSIAHDIDTQWGAMPWGGAYKDSNEYWGPGDYDYY